jgi:pimeloyl-ACP methyl ester carboxylesterase
MTTTTSADGTEIAYLTWGDGPPLVVVSGATGTKAASAELGPALAEAGFTAVAYDRRGRVDSGDTRPYAVEREIEDLTAVLTAVGDGPVAVHAQSSGAALALLAAAAGAPIRTLSVFEPPYRVDGAPPVPADYVDRLQAMYDEDRRADMLEYFLTTGVGQPQEAVDAMKQQPMWEELVRLGQTTLYDARVLGDSAVPTDVLDRVEIPVLALGSTASIPWLPAAAQAAAAAVPDGRFQAVDGVFHNAPPEVLAPVLAAFHAMGG